MSDKQIWKFDHPDKWSRVDPPYRADDGADFDDMLRDHGFSRVASLGVSWGSFSVEAWESSPKNIGADPWPDRWLFILADVSRYHVVVVEDLPSYIAFFERMTQLALQSLRLDKATDAEEEDMKARQHRNSLQRGQQ